MEEKILEIIDKNCDNDGYCYDNAAKEIAEHFREFIEWSDFGHHPFVSWYDVDETGKLLTFYTDEIDDHRHTLDELYNYWRLNIKDK